MYKFGPQALTEDYMANPALDRAKRNMVASALGKLRSGKPMTRTELFGVGPEFREVQKRILKTLQEMGVIRRIGTNNPSVVLFTMNNGKMLDSVLNSESELTRLVFPGTAPGVISPAVPVVEEEPAEEDEEPVLSVPQVEPPASPGPTLSIRNGPVDMQRLLEQILERQDLILQKVVDPIGENTIWVRDQVIEMVKKQKTMAENIEAILTILRKLE